MMTKADVFEALHYARRLAKKSEEPWGNYPYGRDLVEYQLADGRFLQVAWNREISKDSANGGRLDAWRVTRTRQNYWMV